MDNVTVHGCRMRHSERPRRHFKRMLFHGGEDGCDGRNFLSEFIKYWTTVTMFVVAISTTLVTANELVRLVIGRCCLISKSVAISYMRMKRCLTYRSSCIALIMIRNKGEVVWHCRYRGFSRDGISRGASKPPPLN
jgi:hypothetical protein